MLTKTRVTISQRNVIELARCFGRWLLIMRNPDSLEIVDLRGFCRRFTVFCSRFRNGGGSFDRCRGYWILDCWLCGLIFYAAWKIAERKVGDGSRLLLDSVRLGVRLLRFGHRVFLGWCGRRGVDRVILGWRCRNRIRLRSRDLWILSLLGIGGVVERVAADCWVVIALGSASRYLTTTFCTDEVGRVNTQCINHLRANAINSGLSDGDTGQISHLVSTDSQAFASLVARDVASLAAIALDGIPLENDRAVSLRATLMSTIEPDSLVDVSFWARTMCPYQSLVFGEQDGHTGVDFSHGQ
ncbi:hypothetical protein KCV06_g502, partial [Aureobasidium melanogenum]